MRSDQFPKPFFRSARNAWFVQVGGRQVKLHADRDEAFRLYHEMMARPPERRAAPAPAPGGLVAVVLDAFLDWVKANKAPRTYEFHHRNVQRFLDSIPPALTVAELKPIHVTRAMDAQPGWSASTKNGFGRSVQQAFNWAEAQGLIDRTPIRRVEKPGGTARETPVTPAEFEKLTELVKDRPFRDLIEAAWDTGARPNELRRVEARHFDEANARWVFPKGESKGRKKARVVYLTPRVVEACRRMAAANPAGPLFRNRDGAPWTKNAITCRFQRLKGAMGRTVALVDFRHGFCDRLLKNGVDAVAAANILGHSNTAMVATVYSALSQDPEYLRGQARKAEGKG
jgi:integrase